MSTITDIMNKINTLFDKTEIINMAKDAKVIVRDRKISAFELLQSFMMLSLQRNHSLEELVNILNNFKIKVTRQAIYKKTGKSGLEFCKAFLDKALSVVLPKSVDLKGIKEIIVVDSSEISKTKKQIIGQKLQMVVDILGKSIKSLELTALNHNDQSYKKYLKFVTKDSLLIADLGYFAIKSFSEISKKSGLFLFRYFRRTTLRTMNGEAIDLEQLLSTSNKTIDMEVLLSKEGLKVRMIAIKLTDKQQISRNDHIERKYKRDQRLRTDRSELDQWNIFVTNLGSEFSPEACYELYASRWQIEIIFKAMKSSGLMIDQVKANTGLGKILIYVKLIMLVLLMQMTGASKKLDNISYEKLYKRTLDLLGEYIIKAGRWTRSLLKSMVEKIERFCQTSSYKSRPSTMQKVRIYA